METYPSKIPDPENVDPRFTTDRNETKVYNQGVDLSFGSFNETVNYATNKTSNQELGISSIAYTEVDISSANILGSPSKKGKYLETEDIIPSFNDEESVASSKMRLNKFNVKLKSKMKDLGTKTYEDKTPVTEADKTFRPEKVNLFANEEKEETGIVLKSKPSAREEEEKVTEFDLNFPAEFRLFYSKVSAYLREKEKKNPSARELNEKRLQKKLLNIFSIFFDKPYLIRKFYKQSDDKKYKEFTFMMKGKKKSFLTSEEKNKNLTFFEHLLKSYKKLYSIIYKKEELFQTKDYDEADILYDIFGLPVFDYEIKNNNSRERIAKLLPSIIENTNSVVLLGYDEQESGPISQDQNYFHVLNIFKQKKDKDYNINEIIDKTEKKAKEEQKEVMDNRDPKNQKSNQTKKSQTNLNIQLNNPDDILPETLPGILYKTYIFSNNINLSNFKYADLNRLKMVDPKINYDIRTNFSLYYSYFDVKEVLSKFKNVLIMDSELPYEKQINGKFVKILRDDGVTEFRSKWIYTFNVPHDNFELTIGIHQPSKNYGLINTYLYNGLVILKLNGILINFVDYLPLKDTRQNFMKTKLNRGSYMVVPITTGFYLSEGKETSYENIKIENILLIEDYHSHTSKKVTQDLSIFAKNIVDEIFNKYDVYREDKMDLQKLKIFYEDVLEELITNTNNVDKSESYSKEKVEIVKKLFQNYMNSNNEVTIQGFRNFFFFMKQYQSKHFIFDIFRRYGHKQIVSMDCRSFLLTFHTKEKEGLEIRISDGINTKYNAYAFELMIKTHGYVLCQSKSHQMNILCLNTLDMCNVMVLLENVSEAKKKINIDINNKGYITLEENKSLTYSGVLKPREARYLYSLAIDKVGFNGREKLDLDFKFS